MAVHLLTSEEEHITVVSHGAVSLVGVVKVGTLGLGLHGADDIGKSKEREQLLVGEGTPRGLEVISQLDHHQTEDVRLSMVVPSL